MTFQGAGTKMFKIDDEEAVLENRVQSYVARTSLLQTRLLSTLDALDVIQNSHQRELKALVHQQDHMKLKLSRYLDVVNGAKLERDDMRDAVLRLIEKVETSNDYSKWPHSQITLSSLAEPRFISEVSGRPHEDEEILSYATSMIEALRKERDHERRAHAETRELSEARALSLEARLSRYEAELETCVANAEHASSLPENPPLSRKRHLRPRRASVAKEDNTAVLDGTAARNRLLENEIRALSKRLEEARTLSSSSPPPAAVEAAFKKPNIPLNRSASTRKRRAFSLGSKKENAIPIRVKFEKEVDDLRSTIEAFSAERVKISRTISPSSPNGDSKATTPTDNHLQQRVDRLEFECQRLRRSEETLREQLNDARSDAQQREQELLAEIDALRTAQNRQPSVSPTGVYDTDVKPDHPQQPTIQETKIHQEMDAERELHLLEPHDGEMSMDLATPLMPTSVLSAHRLSFSPGTESYPPPRPSGAKFADHHDRHHRFHNDDQAASRGEDIEHEHSAYVDPPSIPLPLSPTSEGLSEWGDNSNSPTLSQAMISASAFPLPPPLNFLPTFPPSHGPLVTHLRRVENDLAQTQSELAVGEEALNRLEGVLHPP